MLALHDAADRRLARVRVPGGRLSAEAMRTLATAAEELGNGLLDVPARASLQLRGLRDGPDVAADLTARLHGTGLLAAVALLDAGLCATDTLRDHDGTAAGREDRPDVIVVVRGAGRFRMALDGRRADRPRAARSALARAHARARRAVPRGEAVGAADGDAHASVAVAAVDVVEVRYHGDTWHLPSLTSTTARLELEAAR